jgi:hypothetical protein
MNNLVAHNTIVQASNGLWAIVVAGRSTGNRILNNIVLASARRGSLVVSIDSLPGLISDHNLLTPRMSVDDGESTMDLRKWRSRGFDIHSQIAPATRELFADSPAGDYRLRAGSLAIDASDASGAPLADLLGHQRPAGRAADIGAYEFGAGVARGKASQLGAR